jgi:hypothetical protein
VAFQALSTFRLGLLRPPHSMDPSLLPGIDLDVLVYGINFSSCQPICSCRAPSWCQLGELLAACGSNRLAELVVRAPLAASFDRRNVAARSSRDRHEAPQLMHAVRPTSESTGEVISCDDQRWCGISCIPIRAVDRLLRVPGSRPRGACDTLRMQVSSVLDLA